MTAPRTRHLRLTRSGPPAADRRVPAAHSRDPLALREALAAAAATAADEIGLIPGGDWPREALQTGASTLADAALECCAGLELPTAQRGIAPALPTGALLAAMRRALLTASRAERLKAELALQALQALELVGVALERDAGHCFSTKLRGRGGLELLIDVAHDMRSPLGSVLFLAEQLRRGLSGAVTPVQERQLGLIYGAAHGLSSLASDVMDLSRGGSAFVASTPHPFSLHDLATQVRDIVRPMVEERRLTMLVEMDRVDMRVGHAGALHRVLLNLVSNAVKFTESGTVTLRATDLGGCRVRFEVQDTGRGIPAHVMATIFDAFRKRVKPGEYVFSSAGLGLSICQTLVTAMGADLHVESVEGQGTRFVFELELPRHQIS